MGGSAANSDGRGKGFIDLILSFCQKVLSLDLSFCVEYLHVYVHTVCIAGVHRGQESHGIP